MKSKIWVILALTFSLSGMIGQIASADNLPDEQWVAKVGTNDGYQGFLLQDPGTGQSSFSYLIGQKGPNSYTCSSLKSSTCADSAGFNYNAVLPVCDSNQKLDCVESLSAVDDAGQEHNAVFSNYSWTDHMNKYSPDSNVGLPVGAAPSLWNFPTTNKIPNSKFLVVANVFGGGKSGSSFSQYGFSLRISPVSEYLNPKFSPAWVDPKTQSWMDTMQTSNQPDAPTRTYGFGPGNWDVKCQSWLQQPGVCEVGQPFPKNTVFTVRLRLSAEPNGWLHGRINQPNIEITNFPDHSVDMKISGGAVNVPEVYFGDSFSNLPKDIQNLYALCGEFPNCDHGMSSQPEADGVGRKANPLTRNIISTPHPWGTDTIKELAVWLPLMQNRANATPSMWSIHTLGSDQFSGQYSCYTQGQGLKGVVTTNAAAYSEGPPKFLDDQLVYQVSAPHFASDNSVFKGTYNLLLRSDVARCLYGFSSAPIQATVQVTDDQGQTDVATTVVGEKNGWLNLSASNFEFSAPTIKMKLTQEKASGISATQNGQVGALKNLSITCQKGKLVKKISSPKPTCPSGYKLKK